MGRNEWTKIKRRQVVGRASLEISAMKCKASAQKMKKAVFIFSVAD